MSIQWYGSPNYWQGRNQPVREIVIHWMVGTLASTDATFQNTATSTSAHYGVENSVVHKYVEETNAAWHALQANPWTIGIEHSAAPGRAASDATYATSIELCADICRRYGLNPDVAIVPHSKYVNTQCCGTVDIDRIKRGVKQGGVEMVSDANHLHALFRAFRGRGAETSEINAYVGKISYDTMIEALDSGPERQKAFSWLSIGRQATTDKWDQQIYGIQSVVKNLNERIAQMTVQMEELRKDTSNKELADALQKRLDDTSAELEKTVKQLKEVQADKDESVKVGNSFIQWIGSLFKRS